MPEPHPGRKALAHMARILEQKPTKDDHELTYATQCLAAFREELIGVREQAPREGDEAGTRLAHSPLAHLNAIISVVMGMHFPLGSPPWEEFAKAKDWLAALVAAAEPGVEA